MKISAIKGFRDVLAGETEVWSRLEERARATFGRYGYSEIRVPIAEKTELFARTAGETSDIVEKQMYTFTDVDGTSMTLRPEGTASVVRAYVENGVYGREPVSKLFYLGPMFRRERPQKGRYRQFHQIGAECLGRDDSLADAELVVMLDDFLRGIGLETARIEVNSLGCGDCRPAYRELLRAYAEEKRSVLCENCNRRIATNPLRILDCKEDADKTTGAPVMVDHLCDACRTHYARVRELLSAEGVSFAENPRMVRGLDYYCRTAFEVVAEGLGAQNAIGGGGRYDGLVADLGGPPIPGTGFALGVERLVLALRAEAAPPSPDVFLAPLGEVAEAHAFRMARRLRGGGLRVEMDPGRKSLKSHMRRADKLGAAFVLIVGDQEIPRAVAVLRDMRTKEQKEVPWNAERIASELKAGTPSPGDDV